MFINGQLLPSWKKELSQSSMMPKNEVSICRGVKERVAMSGTKRNEADLTARADTGARVGQTPVAFSFLLLFSPSSRNLLSREISAEAAT